MYKNLYFLSNIQKKFIKYCPLILHSILLNSCMMNTNWSTKKGRMKEKKKGICYCIMIHNCSLLRLWDSLGFHIFVLCIHLLLWRVWEIRCFTLYTQRRTYSYKHDYMYLIWMSYNSFVPIFTRLRKFFYFS